MKKLLSLIVALVFTVTMAPGCAGLGVIKAEDPKSISTLLKKSDHCKPDGEGFRCLSIPPKNMTPSMGVKLVYLTVYKQGDTYGFGAYSESGYVVWEHSPKEQPERQWAIAFNGTGQYITKEQAIKAWAEWVKLLNEKYNIEGAFCGLAPEEIKGEKT